MAGLTRVDHERIRRTLTFWLRPAFVLRTLTSFQRVAGFDRAVALASSAFTALIPLAIIVSAILPRVDARDAGRTIVNRYGLTGSGAQAVNDLLSQAGGASAQISVIGAILLVLALLTFSRGVQRLLEQTWELKPLSVRNTINDLFWIVGLMAYVALSWWLHSLIDDSRVQIATNIVLLPVSALFLGWTGWVLSARRIERRDLVPFGVVGAALFGVYLTGAAVYVPHLFSSYASRYGAVGAVLAMITTLFGLMVVLVAGATLGREVAEELGRIRRGQRPPEDEVRQEWDALVRELRLRGETLRRHLHRSRRTDSPPDIAHDGYVTPEEAAVGDIPRRFARVVATHVEGNRATVWMLTNEAPWFEPYQAECLWHAGRWHPDSGSGGFMTGTPAEVKERARRLGWSG